MMPPQQKNIDVYWDSSNPFYQPDMNTSEFNFNDMNSTSQQTKEEIEFKLNELQIMYDNNMISFEMFENKKQEIINDIINRR